MVVSLKEIENVVGNKRRQILAGILASLSMFISGSHVGWTSPIKIKMDNYETPFTCSVSDWGWITATISIGSLLGSLTAGTIADRIGRKNMLLCTVPIYIFASGLTYFSHDCWVLYFARIAAGYGLGVSYGICPIYIAEITEPSIRGGVCVFMTFMSNIGVVYSLSVGPYVSYNTFTYITATFPIIFCATFYFMDETPFYQLKQGNRMAAMHSMMKLRGVEDEKLVMKELDKMKQTVDAEMLNKTSFRELFGNIVYRRALVIVLGIKFIQYFSGLTAIQAYLQSIFEETNSPIPSEVSGITCGIMQLVGGALSVSIIDHYGRKPLLLTSSLGSAVTLFLVGLYFYLKNILLLNVSAISWLPLVSVMAFMIVQTIGLGSIPPVLLGEMFPTNVKAVAVTLVTSSASVFAFVVVKVFSWISAAYDMYLVFWFCSGCMVFGSIFIFLCVSETSNKSLMEIQEILKSGTRKELELPVWKKRSSLDFPKGLDPSKP